MGFDVTGNTAVLEFAEGTRLAGASVRVSLDMTVREFLSLQRSIAGIAVGDGDASDADVAAMEAAYARFAESGLVGWDLTIGGEPVPANKEGMLSLPLRIANDILNAWISALSSVSPNSGAASGNGMPPAAA